MKNKVFVKAYYNESISSEDNGHQVNIMYYESIDDDDYFESMGGMEIELGTEEWMDVLSDITGKDAYEDEMDEMDDKKIMTFISKLENLGIELI